jgi:hypothetical protein
MSELVGLLNRLPVLASRAAAKLAKEQGRKPRTERPFGSLTSWSSQPSAMTPRLSADAASAPLREAIAEQDTRAEDADPASGT